MLADVGEKLCGWMWVVLVATFSQNFVCLNVLNGDTLAEAIKRDSETFLGYVKSKVGLSKGI